MGAETAKDEAADREKPVGVAPLPHPAGDDGGNVGEQQLCQPVARTPPVSAHVQRQRSERDAVQLHQLLRHRCLLWSQRGGGPHPTHIHNCLYHRPGWKHVSDSHRASLLQDRVGD